jgi:hypothetical protein
MQPAKNSYLGLGVSESSEHVSKTKLEHVLKPQRKTRQEDITFRKERTNAGEPRDSSPFYISIKVLAPLTLLKTYK